MKRDTFQLAMGQMLVEGGAVDANLRRAAMMIRQAGEQGCQIVVLPECLDVGWGHPSALDLAQSVPGEHTEVLAEAARDARIHVVAGITERAEDRIYNAAVLLSPQGEIMSRHRKINELTIVQHLYSTGDCLSVARTPLGTLGVNICADNFPSSLALAHCQARMGAQILLSPCAWAVEAEHDNDREPYGEMWRQAYSTLASLYDMTVVGVSLEPAGFAWVGLPRVRGRGASASVVLWQSARGDVYSRRDLTENPRKA